MSLPFTHLHLHTEYSLLDGANKIKDLAKRVKELGMKSIAMTDHGNMFGAIDFYNTMKKEGIKPIIGMEAYIHNQEELGDKSVKQRFHLCLYAKNEIGYRNLMYLTSKAYMEGFYYYPRINKKLLRENSEGLIASSACLQGEVSWHLNLSEKNVKFGAKGYQRAKEVALEYKEIFGDDFYLELMRHGISTQLDIDKDLIRLSQETGIKLIATNDTHYLLPENAEAHEVFMCIAMNKTLNDPNRLKHSVHEFYLKSPEEIAKLYADIPEALLNTQEIVDKCNLEIKLGNPTPPNFKFVQEYAEKEGLNFKTDEEYFIHKCWEGLEKRLKYIDKSLHQKYKDRLQREIDIICKMKFPGYMLIVWDFVREAKRRKIPVGPGRGSAAGSLVSYCLEITDIDPIPYGLLFERFLNPERVSMPDIDMDFCQSRRGEIIDYVVKKYGRENVAQIITFGKLLAKGVIRDVARVLDMPYNEADKMAKLIPDEIGITLKEAYQKEPKIEELIKSNRLAKKVWNFALQLETLNRNAGTHAAGVVISNEELWKKTPLFKPSGLDTLATQYSGKYIEDVDLIKFDFLGLKTLTVIEEANKLIEKLHGERVNFIEKDVNDREVYKLIQSGHTIGLFQIESAGMQELNRKLKPENFEDMIAVLALYRPGPMESGMVDDFIERKHGRAKIEYMFPELEPILKPTYGVIVYQEQVMQIVQTIGGFSLGGADLVRRAMGKKIKSEMDRLKGEFAEGAEKRGFDKEKAIELFDLIVKFAGYGFNKSHSAAYAMITFYTAYLKTYYPQEFMAALLTSDKDNTDKVIKYIDESKRLGFGILPPDVNKSFIEFSVNRIDDKEYILFGLGAIKGVGESAIKAILKAREEKKFENLTDFISRIDTTKVNKKVLESLIKAGAMDCFNFSRKALLSQIEEILEVAHKVSQAKKMAINSLFGDAEEMVTIEVDIENEEEFELKEILEFEKESIGLYISGHPLDDFRKELENINYTLSSQIEEIEDKSKALFIGKIEDISKKISKKGNPYAVVNLLDFHGNIEFTIFENMMNELENIDLTKPVGFLIQISKDDDRINKKVLEIIDFEEAKKRNIDTKMREKPLPPFFIKIDYNEDETILERLYNVVQQHKRGKRDLKILISSKLEDILLESNIRVNDSIVEDLKEFRGIKYAGI